MLLVFDLDNTLSDAEHRSHLAREQKWDEFHSLCDQDKPRSHVVALLKDMAAQGNEIVVLTGRTSDHAGKTIAWLTRQGIDVDAIYMRPVGDYRHDSEFKVLSMAQIVAAFQRPETALDIIVFEDRDNVVKSLRAAGYTVFQVRDSLY